jgi:hypothetical protein
LRYVARPDRQRVYVVETLHWRPAPTSAPRRHARAPNSGPATSGPKATLPATAKAKANAKTYGQYCRGESKKRIAGQHGTPSSQCVSAAAKFKHDESSGDDDSSPERS